MNCCKNCDDRVAGCHDKCIKYISLKLALQGINEEIGKEMKINSLASHKYTKTSHAKPKAFKKGNKK